MDILSDVLRVVRLSGAVFFTARMSSPWAAASPTPGELARVVMPGAACLTLFHVLVEGTCRLDLRGQPPVQLHAGDVVVLPHGDPHVMGSAGGLAAKPLTAMLPALAGQEIPHLEGGGGGPAARFICGYLHCDQRFSPLVGALPPLLLVRSDGGTLRVSTPADAAPRNGEAAGGQEATWFERTLRFTIEEAEQRRPGGAAMLARLTEILYVETLRAYMAQLPAGRAGWLAGVNDPDLGQALQLLHARPAEKWTVDGLARAVGRSRSALAQRFSDLVGEPPMQYLARWRMHLAQDYLRQPALSIAEVAARVGYESDVAFNRAFRRHVGLPPATWRQRGG
jgi:AraC-like DNA-binding protein